MYKKCKENMFKWYIKMLVKHDEQKNDTYRAQDIPLSHI